LCGACRSHRQLEFSAAPGIESKRKLRDRNRDSSNSHQSQNASADDVYDGILAKMVVSQKEREFFQSHSSSGLASSGKLIATTSRAL